MGSQGQVSLRTRFPIPLSLVVPRSPIDGQRRTREPEDRQGLRMWSAVALKPSQVHALVPGGAVDDDVKPVAVPHAVPLLVDALGIELPAEILPERRGAEREVLAARLPVDLGGVDAVEEGFDTGLAGD